MTLPARTLQERTLRKIDMIPIHTYILDMILTEMIHLNMTKVLQDISPSDMIIEDPFLSSPNTVATMERRSLREILA
jgi:hypothetical protein